MTYLGKLIGNTLFKTTGLMSSKTAMRKSGEIGSQVTALVREKGAVQSDEFQSIMRNVLGKRAKKIDLVVDKEAAIAEMQSRLYMSKEAAEQFYRTSGSMVLPTDAKKNTFLNLRLDQCNEAELVNLSAHESEHALVDAFSLETKILKLLKKIPFIDKIHVKILKKYAPMLNLKSEQCQAMMLQSTEVRPIVAVNTIPNSVEGFMARYAPKGAKEFHDRIRSVLYGTNILEKGKDKQNYFIAGALRGVFKDEACAYTVGGQTERAFYESCGVDMNGKSTSSDLRSYFYKEFCNIFKQEERSNLINWLRTKVGLKPDRSSQDSAIESFNIICRDSLAKKKLQAEENFWQNVTNWSI